MIKKKATPEIAARLQKAAEPLLSKLEGHSEDFKSVLHPDLSADYNICYWGDDGCYYCSDDGVNWTAVKCIT